MAPRVEKISRNTSKWMNMEFYPYLESIKNINSYTLFKKNYFLIFLEMYVIEKI